ncbi:MAG: LysR family transcriptional regulator [Variibacter sp.]
MKRALPPLNPLRTFEVAARHGSFTRAAEELGVTQAAVSRQVALLEDYLGASLFKRSNREIRLSPAGERYAVAIAESFETIERASETFPSKRKGIQSLVVRGYASFLQHWLIPRIPAFYAKHPHIELQLRASIEEVDFAREDVHLWIHFGAVNKPNLVVKPFIRDIIQPVCSPGIAKKIANMPISVALSSVPILQTVHRPRDWKTWLRSVGIDNFKMHKAQVFENSALAYQAAIGGMGIAMAQ